MRGGSGAPRRVRIAERHRMPISGTLFVLEDTLVGFVLDAGAYEALAVLAEEQSALRRVATLVASDPEPEAIFHVVAEEAGRLLHARSAATIRYEGDFALTVGRWVDDELGGFEVGTVVPTHRQRRAHRGGRAHGCSGADRGLPRTARRRGRDDGRAGLPVRGRRAGRGHGRAGLGPRPGRLGGRARGGRRAPARRLRGAGRARARIGGGPRGDQGLAHPHPRGGRDGAPAARAQPARRRAAAARRARGPAARAGEAPGRAGQGDRAAARSRDGARAGARRAARARARPASRRARRPRARGRRWRRSPRGRRCR